MNSSIICIDNARFISQVIYCSTWCCTWFATCQLALFQSTPRTVLWNALIVTYTVSTMMQDSSITAGRNYLNSTANNPPEVHCNVYRLRCSSYSKPLNCCPCLFCYERWSFPRLSRKCFLLVLCFASAEFKIASCLWFQGNRHSHRRGLGGGFKSRAATKEFLPPSEASWISQEQLVVIAPAVSQTQGCCKNSLVVSFSWLSHCGRSSLAHWLTVSHECEEPFWTGGCSSGTDPNKSQHFWDFFLLLLFNALLLIAIAILSFTT